MSNKLEHIHKHNELSEEILTKMPDLSETSKACDIFSLLSDTTRLRILWLLCHSEECVTNIAISVEMSAPAVSFHLRYLRQSGIIVNRKVGKEAYYKLTDTPYANLVHKMIDGVFLIECPNKQL